MFSLNDRRETSLNMLARQLAKKATSSRKLVEDCLARIEAANGEGSRVFLSVDAESALREADAQDSLRADGKAASPFAGIPISVKDLFDVKGQRTRAGSIALNDAPAAKDDAPVVARMRAAGFVIIGRTNMTEFAYSGIGTNPHYGTPASVWSSGVRHVPGGSSSGAAVSVASGMAHAALGTDTGGSCRIPAAFNYLTGYKPTARRVTREGAIPLSTSLDSIGPIARTVSCCSIVDQIIADRPREQLQAKPLHQTRLGVLRSLVETGIDPVVAQAYNAALGRLSDAGVELHDLEMPELGDLPALSEHGGLAAAESYRWHRALLEQKGNQYDPRVKTRILRGAEQSGSHYEATLLRRTQFIEATEKRIAAFDAIVMPTVPIVPPAIDAIADDNEFARLNLLVLRNPTIVNLMDGCAISIPISSPESPPVGLMLAASGGKDAELFCLANELEAVVGL